MDEVNEHASAGPLRKVVEATSPTLRRGPWIRDVSASRASQGAEGEPNPPDNRTFLRVEFREADFCVHGDPRTPRRFVHNHVDSTKLALTRSDEADTLFRKESEERAARQHMRKAQGLSGNAFAYLFRYMARKDKGEGHILSSPDEDLLRDIPDFLQSQHLAQSTELDELGSFELQLFVEHRRKKLAHRPSVGARGPLPTRIDAVVHHPVDFEGEMDSDDDEDTPPNDVAAFLDGAFTESRKRKRDEHSTGKVNYSLTPRYNVLSTGPAEVTPSGIEKLGVLHPDADFFENPAEYGLGEQSLIGQGLFEEDESGFKAREDELEATGTHGSNLRDETRKLITLAGDARVFSARVAKVVATFFSVIGNLELGRPKVVISSQFVHFLDFVYEAIRRRMVEFKETEIEVLELNGPIASGDDRLRILGEFEAAPGGSVLLLSQGNCNGGLDLTTASHLIVCEPLPDPCDERQLVVTVARLGQRNNAVIYKVLAWNLPIDHVVDDWCKQKHRLLKVNSIARTDNQRRDAKRVPVPASSEWEERPPN